MAKQYLDKNGLSYFWEKIKAHSEKAYHSNLYYGQVDNTSTATVFTVDIDGITEYTDGLTIILKNGVITSASGFTLNVNNLGAKPVYSNMAAESRETTIFNINYTMMFVYEHRVEGGNWLCYRGYDSNTNTIGYQVRTNSQSLPMTSIVYRYRLLFTSADREHFVPANNSTSTKTTVAHTVCQDPIDPFGAIVYYGTTASVAAGARPSTSYLWQQNVLSLGYSFNTTNAALTLTPWKPVYVKCTPQANGSAIIDATTPYVQTLPNTEDGKIYIFLGVAYSETNIELMSEHPVYEYKGGIIRPYTNVLIPSNELVTDLGHFDMEEYNWDFWTYLEDKIESGFYKVNDDQDGFDYFFRIERTNNQVYQEWWYEEEGALNRYIRYGWLNSDEWEWNDTTNWVTDEQLSANCYQKWQTYTKQEVDNLLANKADNSTLENNYYTSDTIDDMFADFAPDTMIETTWVNLRTLRDSGKLVKGAWYRIIDYNFITTKLGLMSGNHQFDIVLLAISESMLSESGYACRHAGDHYFEREITEGGIEWLYTVYADDYAENYGDEAIDHSDDIHSVDAFCDSDVRPHPGTGDDVPVLFKTNIEEYTIDEPDYDDAYFYEGTYDLDGDEYDMWSKYEQDPDTGDWVFMQQYALTPIVVENGELEVSPIPETKLVPVNMNAWELKYCLDNDKDLFDWASTDGKGVIYYLKDEFGNEAPYDFKNVMFQRKNITSVSSNILSVFTQGENSRLGLLSNYAITTGNNNYYYYTFDTPYNAGNDSSLFGDSAYNIIKPYIMDGQRHINNIVLGIANNNNIGNNCFDLTLWGTVRDNNLTYNCSNLLMVGLTQSTLIYVRSSTFFSLGATTFGNGCSQNIGSMLTNSEIGDSCNNSNFGTGNMGIKMGMGCSNNTFGTYSYNNTFENGVSNCTFGNYCSYNTFEKSVQSITLPNYTRYCKFETAVSRITFTTSGGSNSSYIQYVTVCRGISNLSVAPTRGLAYETIYYKTGRVETAV